VTSFTCSRCGSVHADLPFSYAAPAPAYWHAIPEAERARRAILGEEQCEIDGEYFFVRARICIPVRDEPRDFEWGVWVSLSRANYERMGELWHQAGREAEPPYFGWLSTELPCYPSTLSLKALVHTRPVGERPVIELEATDHPLALEQRHGVAVQRVREIAEQVLHE
jgi:hypothetical protein